MSCRLDEEVRDVEVEQANEHDQYAADKPGGQGRCWPSIHVHLRKRWPATNAA